MDSRYCARSAVLLIALLSSACATDSALFSSPDIDYSDCQIVYSPIPHVSSAHVVGQERLDRIFALTAADKRRFFRSLFTTTESLIEATMGPAAEWELQLVEEVIGGYEGETTPSLSLTMRSHVNGNIDQLVRVAEAMGYVYIQDSVLVQCPDDGVTNATDALTVVVSDGGRRQFLDADNAALLFGMMIALHNSPDGVGYTYYPNSGRFETLERNVETGETANLLMDVSRRLEKLSNNDIALDVSIEKLEVSFPHNSWSVAKEGESYLAELSSITDRKILADHREQFLAAIEEFLGP